MFVKIFDKRILIAIPRGCTLHRGDDIPMPNDINCVLIMELLTTAGNIFQRSMVVRIGMRNCDGKILIDQGYTTRGLIIQQDLIDGSGLLPHRYLSIDKNAEYEVSVSMR